MSQPPVNAVLGEQPGVVAVVGRRSGVVATLPPSQSSPSVPGSVWYYQNQPYASHTAVPDPHEGDSFVYTGSWDLWSYHAGAWVHQGALQGPAGPSGAPGTSGDSGLSTSMMDYTFSSQVTMMPGPGPGIVKANAPSAPATTVLSVHSLTSTGQQIGPILLRLALGQRVYLQDPTSPDQWQSYLVTGTPQSYSGPVPLLLDAGLADIGSPADYWVQIPVSLHSSGNAIQSGGPVYLGLIYVGPEGPPGGQIDQFSYRHVQTTAANQWVINHGLSFYPSVTAVDSSGRQVVGDVAYQDADTVVLTFSAAFAGEVYLS